MNVDSGGQRRSGVAGQSDSRYVQYSGLGVTLAERHRPGVGDGQALRI